MKPDWDALAEEFKDSTSVLIADVDCTADGKSLCEKSDVRGYPTIKTFAPGDDDGESYEGDRSLDALRKHAESLGPQCDLEHKELCSAEQLPQLEKFAAMSQARREAKLIKLKNAIKKLEVSHEALQKRLSAEFEVHAAPSAPSPRMPALRRRRRARLTPNLPTTALASPGIQIEYGGYAGEVQAGDQDAPSCDASQCLGGVTGAVGARPCARLASSARRASAPEGQA